MSDVAIADPHDATGHVERRALALSMACAFVLAVLGTAVGVATASQIILFDGFYTFLGIGLSWLALRISRVVAAGPTTRYPFGREALTPLIIGVEGVALLATCAYATFNAVLTIVNGGSRAPGGWGVGYAAIALAGPVVVSVTLRRMCPTSELVTAEATQWFAGGMLGVGMLAAFVWSVAIRDTSWAVATRYVDPVLVVTACGLFVVSPVRMIRRTVVELVEGVPDPEIQEPVLAAVGEMCERFELAQPDIRITKIGRKIYVEIDYEVTPEWHVRQSDEVRVALAARLRNIPQDLWMTLEFTSDRTLLG